MEKKKIAGENVPALGQFFAWQQTGLLRKYFKYKLYFYQIIHILLFLVYRQILFLNIRHIHKWKNRKHRTTKKIVNDFFSG